MGDEEEGVRGIHPEPARDPVKLTRARGLNASSEKVNSMHSKDRETIDALMHLALTNKRALCSMIRAAAPGEYAAMEATHAQLRYQMTIQRRLAVAQVATQAAAARARAACQQARVVRLRR